MGDIWSTVCPEDNFSTCYDKEACSFECWAVSRNRDIEAKAHDVQKSGHAPGEGGWYSRFNPQPIEVIEKWGLDHHRASIIQYLVRSDAKGGLEDLKKARWYLDRLISIEEAKNA